MLLIYCPYCQQERPELEFANAGQAHVVRPADMSTMSDADFEAMAFIRENPKGVNLERWRHVHGCGRFFNVARCTVTDKFLKVYKAGEPRPTNEEIVALAAMNAAGTSAKDTPLKSEAVAHAEPEQAHSQEANQDTKGADE
ncbi:MAG: sarcosine oxidase subunit delta [Pseudomonadota bacterium]